VITGFGRTGKFWAHQHWNIKPDLMTSSKGITSGYLPMAAVGVSDEIYKGMIKTDSHIPIFTHLQDTL
jgi:putrescine aminotransferase